MKTWLSLLHMMLVFATSLHKGHAAVHYVNVSSVNPIPPYTNWATAATVIQDAIDVALPGDEVVVTNGVYATGGLEMAGSNRVAVVKPINIRSVNGPDVTVIRGSRESSNTFDPVRCAYLTNGASLVGFTLTDGGTRGFGGGVYGGELRHCVVVGNVAEAGGGATDCALNNCEVRQNNAVDKGGGAYRGTLNNCMIVQNSAYRGGGAANASLDNCLVVSNSATTGGGGVGIFARFHSDGGSGWFGIDGEPCEVRNCTIASNSAGREGGGVFSFSFSPDGESRLSSCDELGCVGTPTLNNCIVQFNNAPRGANHAGILGDDFSTGSNSVGGQMFYSCTTPLPTNGVGNITNAPLFVDAVSGNFRLQPTSPCINAGRNTDAPVGHDLDGNPRIADGTVDMGAYELQPTIHYVNVNSLNPIPPYTNWATAATVVQDAIDVALAGDEVVVTNGVYEAGGRAVYLGMTNRVAVTKAITVRSANGPDVTVIRGYQVPGTTTGDGAVRCVYLADHATLAGFTLTNGAVTRRIYHDPSELSYGVHEVLSGGGVWCESASALVSNCVLTGNAAVYGGGAYWGTLTQCRLSWNFAGRGGGAMRSILNGSILVENTAHDRGGAAHETTLNHCDVSSNSAVRGGGLSDSLANRCSIALNTADESGGGTLSCTLTNCLLTGNSSQSGGGAFGGSINQCTIIRNRASVRAGGVWARATKFGLENRYECASVGCYPNPGCGECDTGKAIVQNSIIYENIAPKDENYAEVESNGPGAYHGTLFYSCTMPLPANTNDFGNITNQPGLFPRFGSPLTSDSPCINAGRNAYAPTGTDLDGNRRIVGGTVDIGAYEFQLPQSALSYAWLQQYGLPTNGSADLNDSDQDGQSNWQEWRARTDPTNSRSALRLLTPISEPSGVVVRWQSVSGLSYFLERSSQIGALSGFVTLASNVTATADTTIFSDTNAPGIGPFFYRVGVQE